MLINDQHVVSFRPTASNRGSTPDLWAKSLNSGMIIIGDRIQQIQATELLENPVNRVAKFFVIFLSVDKTYKIFTNKRNIKLKPTKTLK